MLPSSPFRIVSICLFSLLLTHSVWGQKDAGSIAGTIKDASGATVPQAKVTLTEVDKGTSLVTSTGSSGDYVVSPLPIGHYSVKVEKRRLQDGGHRGHRVTGAAARRGRHHHAGRRDCGTDYRHQRCSSAGNRDLRAWPGGR